MNDCLMRCALALVVVSLASCATLRSAGDAADIARAGCPVSLFEPYVDAYDVSVNGVNRDGPLQWDWGDGSATVSWFPAEHTYAKAGSYMIRARARTRVGHRVWSFAQTMDVEVTGRPVQGEQLDNLHRLTLLSPAIHGRKATVNGVVVAPVERIQWNWGDGAIDRHHWFPASHEYEQPGEYVLQVVTVDKKQRTTTKAIRLRIE